MTAVLYGDSNMTEYYLGNALIPYNANTPVVSGYESAYLQYLGLDPDSFRVKSAAWRGGWTTDKEGHSVRYVTLHCSRQTWHDGNPAVTYYSAEAVYSNGLTDGPDRYEIQASANYVATKAGIASGSLWFVAAAVGSAALITILVITLKKRRDNDSEY